MRDRLEQINQRYQKLNQQLALPEIATDLKQLQTLAQEKASIEDLVTKYRQYKTTAKQLEETRTMLGSKLDEGMSTLVKQEIENLETQLDHQLQELKLALLPKDANDERDIIMEIRAGAGGDEASLFAADLFRMYTRYAQSKGWEADIIDSSESGVGGFKEIIFEIKGKGVFSRLKHESGVHRVQLLEVVV